MFGCIFSRGHVGDIVTKKVLLTIEKFFRRCLTVSTFIVSKTELCLLWIEEVLVRCLQLDISFVIHTVGWRLWIEMVLCRAKFVRSLVTVSDQLVFNRSKISLLIAMTSRWLFKLLKDSILNIIEELSLRVFFDSITDSRVDSSLFLKILLPQSILHFFDR